MGNRVKRRPGNRQDRSGGGPVLARQRQGAVGLAPRAGADSRRHLSLHREVERGEQGPASQEAEDQGGRDVVRDVRHHPNPAAGRILGKLGCKVESQGVGDPHGEGGRATQNFGEGGGQLPVEFHRIDTGPAAEQGLGQGPRAGADLHHGIPGADARCGHDGIAHPRVHQEMLPPGLPRAQAAGRQDRPRPGTEPGHPAAVSGAVACFR
jgi:hypothetical protein